VAGSLAGAVAGRSAGGWSGAGPNAIDGGAVAR
jgi:hypothetical protein